MAYTPELSMAEYEKTVLRGEDLKVIILKCELHTGNGFIAAEGTGARRIAQDNGDINKSLKMTEKSAHIDATLRVAGLSELFTQDLEDMANGAKQDIQQDSRPQVPPQKRHNSQQPAGGNGGNGAARRDTAANHQDHSSGSNQSNGGHRITGKQYKFVMDLMKNTGMTKQELNAHCMEAYGSVVDHITRADASSLIDWLQSR